jgi:hypothetical protein
MSGGLKLIPVSRAAVIGFGNSAGAEEDWIIETYANAFAKATDDERAMALRYLENWLKTRRE